MNKKVSLFCRISVSLLALVMLFTFVGCQETPADPAQTDPAQTDPAQTDPTVGSLSQAFGEVEEAAVLHLLDTWNILDLEEEAE